MKKNQKTEPMVPKKDFEDLQRKFDETESLMKRIQADFENYKKRVDIEKNQSMEYSRAKVLESLLSIVDTFELALKNVCNPEEFTKGIELIYTQMLSLLEAQGVKHIDTKEKMFDPHFHEALLQENNAKTPEDDGKIIEELQKGYTINNKVLRASKVKIKRYADIQEKIKDTKLDKKDEPKNNKVDNKTRDPETVKD